MSVKASSNGDSIQYNYWIQWQHWLVINTERFLSWRLNRRRRRRQRQQKKNPFVDWLEAIGSAIFIVLLINQFLLQAYQIPSESMVPTLLVGDRIFVNKLIYGPELVPGAVKFMSPRNPRRGEVIILENPTYPGVSPLVDLLQRVVYMATLSIVNIDTDNQGRPRAHFLIKRAIGMPGDRVRISSGHVEIMVGGSGRWILEEDLMRDLGLTFNVTRLFPVSYYSDLRIASVARVRAAAGMIVSESDRESLERILSLQRFDHHYSNLSIARARYELEPSNQLLAQDWSRMQYGWIVPDKMILPMGDNRDDSRDGRDFGPVHLRKILGQGLFHYWPPSRWGSVN